MPSSNYDEFETEVGTFDIFVPTNVRPTATDARGVVRGTVQVEVSCRDNGAPPLTSTRLITVRVIDDNDNTPQLERGEVFTVDVRENNHVGDVILVVNASDLDEGRNAEVSFHLEPLDSPRSFSDVVSIDHHSGVITAMTTFDFESRQTYSFLLTLTDGGLVSHSRVATVVLNVVDENDEVPTFIRSSYTFRVPENRAPGSTVGRIRATDADLSAQHRAVFYSLEEEQKQPEMESEDRIE